VVCRGFRCGPIRVPANPVSRIRSCGHSATRYWPAQWSNVPATAGSMVQRAGYSRQGGWSNVPAGTGPGDLTRRYLHGLAAHSTWSPGAPLTLRPAQRGSAQRGSAQRGSAQRGSAQRGSAQRGSACRRTAHRADPAGRPAPAAVLPAPVRTTRPAHVPHLAAPGHLMRHHAPAADRRDRGQQ
jgi:hypothetical protein